MYVHIAKGADSGEVILHRGRGNIVNGCAPGDLKLLVIVAEHPSFPKTRASISFIKKKSVLNRLSAAGRSVPNASLGEVVHSTES